MYDFFSNSEFLKAVKEEDCFVFRNLPLPQITWEMVVKCMDKSVKEDYLNVVGKPNKAGFILRRAQFINEVVPVMEAFNSAIPDLQVSGHIYVSFSTESGTLGRHRSKSSVFFWQAIGKTQWTVSTKRGDETYILKPNDAIYCPSLMYHDVVPLSPRVGISLGLDHLYKKDVDN
jgi:ribosomal protein L16 Arg81 hydroxylase